MTTLYLVLSPLRYALGATVRKRSIGCTNPGSFNVASFLMGKIRLKIVIFMEKVCFTSPSKFIKIFREVYIATTHYSNSGGYLTSLNTAVPVAVYATHGLVFELLKMLTSAYVPNF